jgi:hypothetical protein
MNKCSVGMSLKKVESNKYEIMVDESGANPGLLIRSIRNILLDGYQIDKKIRFHAIKCDIVDNREKTMEILMYILFFITSQMEFLESNGYMIRNWDTKKMLMVDDKRVFYMGDLVVLNNNNILDYCKFVESYASECKLNYIERKRIVGFTNRCRTQHVILWL